MKTTKNIDNQEKSITTPVGRIGRLEFLKWTALLYIIFALVYASIIFTATTLHSLSVVLPVLFVPIFYVFINLIIKRLHDMSMSGLWFIALVMFTPAVLILYAIPSTKGVNAFGKAPVKLKLGKK